MFNPIRRLRLSCIFLSSLIIAGCGGGNGARPLLPGPDSDFADLKPYDENGEYASVLTECVTATASTSCTLNKLPIIGMKHADPTTADIMARVVVSHDWMGERFAQALEALPTDIRLLLRATTAIVIDADIRPAFYTVNTGAIYLDPAFLWLTSDELATINAKADYRSGFSDPLQFRVLHRYVRNNAHIYPYSLLQQNPHKTLEDVTLLIGQLLYHELAHANDFLPPSTWDYLNASHSVYEAIMANEAEFVGVRLAALDPLTSPELYRLARVMYRGTAPSAADLAITAEEVGQLFEADGASDHYAYASIFEDTAMLFEETMMKHHFDIDRDVAFTEVPEDRRYCDLYTIGWGTRNRIGDNDVKARAQFVIGEILPSLNLDLFFQELPAPQPMTPGHNWCLDAPHNEGAQKTTLREVPPMDLRLPH